MKNKYRSFRRNTAKLCENVIKMCVKIRAEIVIENAFERIQIGIQCNDGTQLHKL